MTEEDVNYEAVHWIREASKKVLNGNCSFVDDDLHLLTVLAERAVVAGLTEGLSTKVLKRIAAKEKTS